MTSVPTATYRLQLRSDFPFPAVEAVVPYLASLGVSHLHLSPVLQAAPGSTHGYDVVDHTRISDALGGEQGLRSLAATARGHGLGLVVDIVPNHMAVPAPEYLNQPLWSVLREGPASPYARWFDIDWAAQDGRVLLPVLGGRIGEELDSFTVERHRTDSSDRTDDSEGETILRYHDHAFPVRPGTEELPLPELLRRQWYRPAWWRLAGTELNYRRFFTISGLIGLRVEDPQVFEATHRLLLRLVDEGVIDGLRIDHPDGLADPRGYLRLLHQATGGRWTVVEKVLTGEERLPGDWSCAGTTGYDALHHVDGLFVCPAGARELTAVCTDFAASAPSLQAPAKQHVPDRRAAAGHASSPDAAAGAAPTAPPEPYPDTPYRDRPAYRDRPYPVDRLLRDHAPAWGDTARRAARETVGGELGAEVERLTRIAYRICARDIELRDHSARALRTAIEELLIGFPVYRPYVVPGEPPPPESAAAVEEAAAGAGYAFEVPEEAAAVNVVRDLTLGLLGRSADKDDFAVRFAQVSSAVRAKGVEDTAFYRWYPLLSANEVGGDPGSCWVDLEDFHAYCERLQRHWPASGTVLSTHDTKRSGDVRAQIAALTEDPAGWRAWLTDVSERCARFRTGDLPDPDTEYLVWQTAVGMAPSRDEDRTRLLDAVLKSMREAKLHTSWTAQNSAYEEAVLSWAGQALAEGGLASAAEFVAAGARWESIRANVLGAALLHLTMPGVPDVYQGTETACRTLVDPDNRRPIDFEQRARLLRLLDDGRVPQDLEEQKLLLTITVLRLRARRPHWFGARAGYTPLHAVGPAAAHAVAFSRADRVVPVAARFTRRLRGDGGWRNTVLPLPGPAGAVWTEALTGRSLTASVEGGEGTAGSEAPPGRAAVRLAELLDALPVALLVRD